MPLLCPYVPHTPCPRAVRLTCQSLPPPQQKDLVVSEHCGTLYNCNTDPTALITLLRPWGMTILAFSAALPLLEDTPTHPHLLNPNAGQGVRLPSSFTCAGWYHAQLKQLNAYSSQCGAFPLSAVDSILQEMRKPTSAASCGRGHARSINLDLEHLGIQAQGCCLHHEGQDMACLNLTSIAEPVRRRGI